MNKEQEELLSDAYDNFANAVDKRWEQSEVGDLDDMLYYGLLIDGTDENGEWFARIPTKEEFIGRIESDNNFANKWGVVYEERKLTWDEQVQWVMKNTDVEWENLYIVEEITKDTTPKLAISITYNNKTIESYGKL